MKRFIQGEHRGQPASERHNFRPLGRGDNFRDQELLRRETRSENCHGVTKGEA